MTDKEQVIIDGVDVNKCEWFKDGMCYAECDLEGYTDWECKDEELSNCYYKQLARKTQECEEYKKRAVYFKDVNKQLGYKYLTIKQECEEMKKQLMQKDEVDMFFNTPLEGWSSNPCGICEYKGEYDRYREALEEIETVTKINCEEICGRKFADCKDTSCFSVNILDIINKAKGEGNGN